MGLWEVGGAPATLSYRLRLGSPTQTPSKLSRSYDMLVHTVYKRKEKKPKKENRKGWNNHTKVGY